MNIGDLIWRALVIYVGVVATTGAMTAIYLGLGPNLAPSRLAGWGAVGVAVVLVGVAFTWFLISSGRSKRPV